MSPVRQRTRCSGVDHWHVLEEGRDAQLDRGLTIARVVRIVEARIVVVFLPVGRDFREPQRES